MRCACAVRKKAILDPFPPMAKVTAVTTVFPCTGLLGTQSKHSDHECNNKLCFALTMPDCSIRCFCPVDVAPPVVGGVQGGRRNANLLLGAMPALCPRCARAVQKGPQGLLTVPCGSA